MYYVPLGLLAFALYTGPFIPLLVTLLFSWASHTHLRRNGWAFLALTGLQTLSYAPYLAGLIYAPPEDYPTVLPSLFFPAGLGLLLFPATLIYAVVECCRLRSSPRPHPVA